MRPFWIILGFAVLFYLSLFDTNRCNASTALQAQQVYSKLYHSNGFWIVPKLRIINDSYPNAGGNRFYLYITTGMLKLTSNTDELALVLGHELGHIHEWHWRSSYSHEYIADRLGFTYANNAGYNACHGKAILLKLSNGWSKDHPNKYLRYKALKCH